MQLGNPTLVSENLQATQVFHLATHLAAKRCASMLAHNQGWPLQLALLCSQDQADVHQCLRQLREDYQLWLDAKQVAASDLFLKNLVKQSPFQGAVMQDLGELVTSVPDVTAQPALVAQLQEWAHHLFQGWGTTKMIEDGNGILRDREDRDSKRKVLRCTKQWDVLRSNQLVASQRREEVKDPLEEGEVCVAPLVHKSLYSARARQAT
eukprot:10773742-Lingulodinium_polyedra.AAC.1